MVELWSTFHIGSYIWLLGGLVRSKKKGRAEKEEKGEKEEKREKEREKKEEKEGRSW